MAAPAGDPSPLPSPTLTLHPHSCDVQGLEWPRLRAISSTGEASAPEDYLWLYAATRYRVPVIEYCGGTELGEL